MCRSGVKIFRRKSEHVCRYLEQCQSWAMKTGLPSETPHAQVRDLDFLDHHADAVHQIAYAEYVLECIDCGGPRR